MEEETRKTIEYLFTQASFEPRKTTDGYWGIEELNPSGSGRKYFRIPISRKPRLPGELGSVVACLSPNTRENRTFLILTEYLAMRGIKVPNIYCATENSYAYLLQDLGGTDLFSMIKACHKEGRSIRDDQELKSATEKTLAQLVKLQRLPREEWKGKVEFPPFDQTLIRYDFKYAVDNLLEPSGVTYDNNELHKEFDRLELRLLSWPEGLWGLMYRDFQSRNIMFHEGEPYFIDYQSARKGPCVYDLVSFAWQAKAQFSPEERDYIIDTYTRLTVEQLKKTATMGEAEEKEAEKIAQTLKDNIKYWAAFRILQTLGAYGLRGLKEGKRHFIESIPSALSNMAALMKDEGLEEEFPEMSQTIEQLKKKFYNFA